MIPYHPIEYIIESPIHIALWSTMFAFGCLMGLLLMIREAKRKKVDSEVAMGLFISIVLGAFVGMKLLSNIISGRTGLDLINIFGTGSASLGGLAGIVLAMIIYSRLKKMSFWFCADICSFGVAVAAIFIKLGCHLSGCIDSKGSPTNLPWAIMDDGVLVHPTALYAMLFCIALLIILLYLRQKQPFDGFIFLSHVFLYSSFRLIFENPFRNIGVDIDLWYALLPLLPLALAFAFLMERYRRMTKQ